MQILNDKQFRHAFKRVFILALMVACIYISSDSSAKENADQIIETLEMEAYVANWDLDSENDGLIVHLYPGNSKGELVPAVGEVQFKLFDQHRDIVEKNQVEGQVSYPEITSWRMQIHPEDFTPEGIILKLKFNNFNPDHRPELVIDSLFTASLQVPKVGHFQASDRDVFIRLPRNHPPADVTYLTR